MNIVGLKNQKKTQESEFFTSATNIQTINYKVYYMKPIEKVLYFILAFVVGAVVAYLFYGGIGKDDFGNPTKITWILNITIPVLVGVIAGKYFIPMRVKQIIKKRRSNLSLQFRDMLDALTTSLGAGKNVTDAFMAVYDDLKVQYEEGSYILQELEVILSGIQNNIPIEDMLTDFGHRSAISDIESFANVFQISYRKGGNIKDIIRNTHNILSEKMEIQEDIETIVTANKTEQNIMIVMPIALIGIIKLMSADFAANFVTTTGIISTTIAITLFVIAYWLGTEILDIKI